MFLPPSLTHWSPYLSLLKPHLIPVLGEMVRHLDAALGPIRKHHFSTQGEPEGFDGLTHKGSYQHLLASEWLIADLWPNEFLRRACNGEHLFYKRGFRDDTSMLSSVLLLDCGPAQMGAPRLVHLALLIVLARRAEAAGASFSWGILQDPLEGLFPLKDQRDWKRFLNAICWDDVGEEHFSEWKTYFQEHGLPGDVWVAGARAYQHRGLGPRSIVIHDPPQMNRNELDITFMRPSGQLAIKLELPDRKTAYQLLSHPFMTQGKRLDHHTSMRLVFSRDGRRIFLTQPDRVCVYRLPNSPGDKPGRCTIHTLKDKLMGVVSYKKMMVCLCSWGETWSVVNWPTKLPKPNLELVRPYFENESWVELSFLHNGSLLFWSHGEGPLVLLKGNDCTVLDAYTLEVMVNANDHIVYNTSNDPSSLNFFPVNTDLEATWKTRLRGEDLHLSCEQQNIYFAVCTEPGQWIVGSKEEKYEASLTLPMDHEVLGIICRGPSFKSGCYLVSFSTEKPGIYVHLSSHNSIAINGVRERPLAFAIHGFSGRIALLTPHHELLVYSIPHDQYIYGEKLTRLE